MSEEMREEFKLERVLWGRKPAIIDWDKANKMIKAGANSKQVAAGLGVSLQTFINKIRDRYGIKLSEYMNHYRSSGEAWIYEKQYDIASEGNTQMLIWLGKVRLGQKEAADVCENAPNQEMIEKDHEIMRLNHELQELRNALQSETE